jgi:hypothetical protein
MKKREALSSISARPTTKTSSLSLSLHFYVFLFAFERGRSVYIYTLMQEILEASISWRRRN